MKELSMGMHLPFLWFLNPLKHPWLCLLQNPRSEGSNTIVVMEHTPSREDRTRRFGVHLWHLISLFAQGVSDGSHVWWLFLLWFFRATEQRNMQVSILFGYFSSWLWSKAIIHCLWNDIHCMEEKPFGVCQNTFSWQTGRYDGGIVLLMLSC